MNYLRILEFVQIAIIHIEDVALFHECSLTQNFSRIAIEIYNINRQRFVTVELDFFDYFPGLSFVRPCQLDWFNSAGLRYQYNTALPTEIHFIDAGSVASPLTYLL